MIHKFLDQDKSKGHYHKQVCHQSNQGTNANQSVTVAQESRFSVNSHHVATPIYTTTPAAVSETSSSINNIRRGIDNVHVTTSCKDYLPQSQIYNTPKLKENQINFQSSMESSQFVQDRAKPICYNNGQREIINEMNYRPQCRPSYIVGTSQSNTANNFCQNIQGHSVSQFDQNSRIPIFSEGYNLDPLRQIDTTNFQHSYSQNRDNFSNPILSANAHLIHGASQITNSPFDQISARPIETTFPMANHPVHVGQTMSHQVDSTFYNPVDHASNNQTAPVFGNSVGHYMNNPMMMNTNLNPSMGDIIFLINSLTLIYKITCGTIISLE